MTSVPHLVSALSGYLEPDSYGEPGRGYLVYSTYWDSPNWTLFWEKIEGLEVRRKLRLRRYVGSPDLWVEIKQRIDRTQQKRRLRVSPEVARSVFAPSDSGQDPSVVDHPVLQEASVLCHRYRLTPRMAILYRRRPFLGRYEPSVRVNFDSRIQYRAAGLDLTEPFTVGKYVLDPRVAVMEIKFTGMVPLWLTKTVTRFGLRLVRMSKYCSAVDREYFGGSLT